MSRAFVHSLVKIGRNADLGWCAPLELGEAAPHYISFVVPLTDGHEFFDDYTCEVVVMEEGKKTLKPMNLVRRGEDSFSLRVRENEIWFVEKPSARHPRRLPYVGKLGHEDFRHRFVEIEPDDPIVLDKMYDDDDTFIIGCEPFTHYSKIGESSRIASSSEI